MYVCVCFSGCMCLWLVSTTITTEYLRFRTLMCVEVKLELEHVDKVIHIQSTMVLESSVALSM